MQRVLFTPERQAAVLQATQGHAAAWQATHEQDSIEAALDAESLAEEHLLLYYAAELRLAMLNPAVPATEL